MRKIYYLSTCNTCKRIIKELDGGQGFELQNVKESPITSEQLDYLVESVGSYEQLFNRRSRKYQSMGLKNKELSELDYKKLILEEYTFLKRPVIIIDKNVFVGNSKKVVEMAKQALKQTM